MEPWWIPPMRAVVADRPVVFAGAVAAAWTEHVGLVRELGARDVLVVATEGRGAGPVPDAPTVVVDAPADLTLMERIRFGTTALEHPPDEIVSALADFDPGREAVVIGTFLNTAAELDGRPFVSYRRPEWLALEDKVVVDGFWDRAGVVRQPSAVVALDRAAATAPALDHGHGTVWSADARDGFHGGASLTFRVTDEASGARATEALRDHCDRVRVMPFIEGIPTSIHGIVLPDGIVVLRPVEMIVLRHRSPDRSEHLVYAGCATHWDPPDAIRVQMRDVARRVGRRLADEVAFRGTFTVDGVAGADGFWPTELNPRFGAGIMTLARAGLDMPVLLLNEWIGGGHDIGRTAQEIEEEILTHADAHRGGGTWKGGVDATVACADRAVTWDDATGWAWASDDDLAAGQVTSGAGFVRCRYEADLTPVGPSTATRAARFWEFADRELGSTIGPLTPAADQGR